MEPLAVKGPVHIGRVVRAKSDAKTRGNFEWTFSMEILDRVPRDSKISHPANDRNF
jgi:hypothetical protein